MKSILKKILPWHVVRTLASARKFYSMRKPPFHGVYRDFGEVPGTPAWNRTGWIEASRLATEKKKRQIGNMLPEAPLLSRALLPVAFSMLAAHKDHKEQQGRAPAILDFGGAAGTDYANLLAALGNPREDFRYHVVDTPGCCEAGRAIWKNDPRITFSPELPDPSNNLHRFDIVYASGSLHLVENFRTLLESFARFQPAVILIGKTSMHDGPSFVRQQTNMGKGLDNPQWALGIRDVADTLEKAGYTLTFRGYSEDLHNADNYNESHKVDKTANLLFLREANPQDPA